VRILEGNYILYFLQLFIILSLPPFMVYLSIRAFYYPMIDLIGAPLCYYFHIVEGYLMILFQIHSFFIALFRYICIIHNERLFKLGISGHKLARIILFIMFCLPAIFESAILLPFTPGSHLPLDMCLGKHTCALERGVH
jgi:hypothetical protein